MPIFCMIAPILFPFMAIATSDMVSGWPSVCIIEVEMINKGTVHSWSMEVEARQALYEMNNIY